MLVIKRDMEGLMRWLIGKDWKVAVVDPKYIQEFRETFKILPLKEHEDKQSKKPAL